MNSKDQQPPRYPNRGLLMIVVGLGLCAFGIMSIVTGQFSDNSYSEAFVGEPARVAGVGCCVMGVGVCLLSLGQRLLSTVIIKTAAIIAAVGLVVTVIGPFLTMWF